MSGHWVPVMQTAGKQALAVPRPVTLYVQQEALLPHGDEQAVPKVTIVQKHGMSAGVGWPNQFWHEHLRLPHSVPVAVQGLPTPMSLPALGGQPGGKSGMEKTV